MKNKIDKSFEFSELKFEAVGLIFDRNLTFESFSSGYFWL